MVGGEWVVVVDWLNGVWTAICLLTDKTDVCRVLEMQTTLRINDEVYRDAKVQAAREGVTLTRWIEEALRERIARASAGKDSAEVEERNQLMEAMLKRTARFRIGHRPTREEMSER